MKILWSRSVASFKEPETYCLMSALFFRYIMTLAQIQKVKIADSHGGTGIFF